MRLCSHEFGNGMCKSGERGDMENWEGILSFNHAPSGQNDGNEVDTGVAKQREGGGFGQ